MKPLYTLAALFALSLPATAQVVTFTDSIEIDDSDPGRVDLFVADQTTLDGQVCIGDSCFADETINSNTLLKLKSGVVHIEFDDRSTGGTGNDWKLLVNDNGGANLNRFSIEDTSAGTVPFTVEAGAPDNSLWVRDTGKVGIGTMFPGADLTIVSQASAAQIQMRNSSTVAPSNWLISANDASFTISDSTNFGRPLYIEAGAPNEAIVVRENGDVGMGIFSPDGALHVGGNGTKLAYLESTDGGAVQMRFRSDSQNRRFLAVDNNDNVQTQMQFRDNEILFLGATTSQEWMRVNAMGITTAGPSCNPNPCDRTFDPTYFEIQPIAERAAQMWQDMHLPAVGPTAPNAPFNVTEKMGGVIHELEVAHIYIAQLEDRLAAVEALNANNAALATHVATLTARLTMLETSRQD